MLGNLGQNLLCAASSTLPIETVDWSHSVPTLGRAMLGTWEIIAILAVVVLLFGSTKLPQLGKGLGEAIGNFKKAKQDGEQQALRTEIDATPRTDAAPVVDAVPRLDAQNDQQQRADSSAAAHTGGVKR